MSSLPHLLNFLKNAIGQTKPSLIANVVSQFNLTQDRSVYYCADFAIRFSQSKNTSFSNTVLSLSNLKKFDNKPFIVCLVTPTINVVYLANSTFLKKISHSSQDLRVNNIKGSFNGSDIIKKLEDIDNKPENFEQLFRVHENIGFEDNLVRLVEATNNICPTGIKFLIDEHSLPIILDAPQRAQNFERSDEAKILKSELDQKVTTFKSEILLASLIENVNVRGRVIEYLIAGENEQLRQELITALQTRTALVPLTTGNALGDYLKNFPDYTTATDIKTKIMVLSSHPKAYNLDKVLAFLAQEKSVFMFYFIGINPNCLVDTVLVSIFDQRLLNTTILLRHWAGRNSRGVTQFDGREITKLIEKPWSYINIDESKIFLEKIINL